MTSFIIMELYAVKNQNLILFHQMTMYVVCNRIGCSCYVIAASLSFHIILNPTRADFLQNHGESASFLCWENERKHLILLTFFNVTLL